MRRAPRQGRGRSPSSPSGGASSSRSTRLAPPSRFRSTPPLEVSPANSGSSGASWRPMMTTRSQSAASPSLRDFASSPAASRKRSLLPETKKISSSFIFRSRRLGLAVQRQLDDVRGLVVQAVGHVEVGLGQRVALVEFDRRLGTERVGERCRPFEIVAPDRRQRRGPEVFLFLLPRSSVSSPAPAASVRRRCVSDGIGADGGGSKVRSASSRSSSRRRRA